jgi:heterodisulfide reductase subunit B
VVACPFCHVNLDSRQKQIEAELERQFGLPVLYFTQLMGLAFGLGAGALGLGTHFVDPGPLLRERGLMNGHGG